jgi:hypothetical protein
MTKFESLIGLMHGNGPGSGTLAQHCSAMRMDGLFAWTSNQLLYALTDARRAVAR